MPPPDIEAFLRLYDAAVSDRARLLRDLLLQRLPGVTEQLDVPARMIAYGYGNRYAELVCTIIPSKKGLKLGFNRGVDLPDPEGLLKGTGKISRYVPLQRDAQVQMPALADLLDAALQACRQRMATP